MVTEQDGIPRELNEMAFIRILGIRISELELVWRVSSHVLNLGYLIREYRNYFKIFRVIMQITYWRQKNVIITSRLFRLAYETSGMHYGENVTKKTSFNSSNKILKMNKLTTHKHGGKTSRNG